MGLALFEEEFYLPTESIEISDALNRELPREARVEKHVLLPFLDVDTDESSYVNGFESL